VRLARAEAHPRAGLVGHPSDGYGGRTLALTFANFAARAVVYEWGTLEVLPAAGDRCRFDSLDALMADAHSNGYDGGLRLVKAAIKRLADHARRGGHELTATFSVRYESDIPRQVGLGGSSAIVTATLRALCRFDALDLSAPELASLALAVEVEELGLTAGLQDRVAQAHEGLVYMDFEAGHMARHGHGRYERLDPGLLPPLFVAFRHDAAQASTVVHGDLRGRYERDEPGVREAMGRLGELAAAARDALLEGDRTGFARLLDAGFDERRRLYEPDLRHVGMVQTARSLGASATFAGSGGAVIGTYEGAHMLDSLREAYAAEGCTLLEPRVG
jgi:glucuronokinase